MKRTVESVSLSEARSCFSGIIDQVTSGGSPVFIARRGRRVAAVIEADALDRLIELAEDMIDIRAAAEAREEMERTTATPIPWERVKADLGLT